MILEIMDKRTGTVVTSNGFKSVPMDLMLEANFVEWTCRLLSNMAHPFYGQSYIVTRVQ